jgi:hypothetical protein
MQRWRDKPGGAAWVQSKDLTRQHCSSGGLFHGSSSALNPPRHSAEEKEDPLQILAKSIRED